jgi:hypothetical protein
MYGESGYAAAYVHLFYVLSYVERYVDSQQWNLYERLHVLWWVNFGASRTVQTFEGGR